MRPISEVVDDPEWQDLRRSFLGTWKTRASENTARLRRYVGDGTDPLKNRRALNYLTGTGFRLGLIGCPEADALRDWLRTLPRA